MPKMTQYQAIGRRKTSTARVYLRPGDGSSFVINERDAEEYFPIAWRRRTLDQPFDVTDTIGHVEYDEELRGPLRDAGYLTRDDRMVERKKYGQPGARKKSQYSKR
ncbi:MAG: 30S ribosomal protein S9 [Bacteroidetes bacterium QS_4_64_154]|nr:MAG: 30S ribosomal protein S9 [Bacteroidetes bacterium QS_4_64_154]